ncbi:uncharacterized protein [Drosophila virilis]|uniref:Uncharacterized protein n=1 Tax=Drosophila virilis TaxID=7244 RepID=A0A0Q9WGK8_DROVI|nr:uncharacterized protein LOC26531677 [Drosophila virilis]KRF83689.1 uncharacterized protein Dvir_GJ26907 [Drosophila virilis]
MKINWQTFPKLFVVLPVLHYALSLFMQSESEEHKRRKEQEKASAKDVTIARLMQNEGQK